MTIIVGFLIAIFLAMILAIVKMATYNMALRQRLAVLEHQGNKQRQEIELLLQRTSPKELSQEQKEFKNLIERKWKKAMEEMSSELAVRLKEDSNLLVAVVEKYRDEFDGKIKAEYKKATESIAFHKVEYKKTITKKRRDYSRTHKAVPKKDYRSIDDV